MRRFLAALSIAMLVACHGREPSTAETPPTSGHAARTPIALRPALEASFQKWEAEGPTGDVEHRARLDQLAGALRKQLAAQPQVDVLFVCTHNSRRSHMAQLLGLAAARRKGLGNVRTYSGGTEATAFNARAVAALGRAGFEIAPGDGENPHRLVRFSDAAEPVEAYSKRFTDAPNPKSGFVVVMTCSQADAACPFVSGAVARVAVPYDDPKSADGTPEETARYDERVAQIGRDLAWVFGEVASVTARSRAAP